MYQLNIHLQRVQKSQVFLYSRSYSTNNLKIKKKSRSKKKKKKKSEKEHRNELNNFKSLLNITKTAFDPLGWLSVLTTKTLQRNWHCFAFQGWSRMEGWGVCECVHAVSPFINTDTGQFSSLVIVLGVQSCRITGRCKLGLVAR